MKHLKTFFLATICMFLIVACGGNKIKHAKISGVDLIDITKDTTVLLTSQANSPRMTLHLNLQCAADGEKSAQLNDVLLSNGVLFRDFIPTGRELTPQQAVDSMAEMYAKDYQREYGALYRVDPSHPESYNYTYSAETETTNGAKNIVNYISHIIIKGGDAHEIKQTVVSNIDYKENKLVTLVSLFDEDGIDALKDIIVNQLQKQFKKHSLQELSAEGIFADGMPYVSDNFIYEDDGITFIYCEDEIAPHDIGEIRVKVKNNELKKLWKKS